MTQMQHGADLHEEFPRWVLSDSKVSRQWAMLRERPTTAQIKAGWKLYLDADTRQQLRERLREEEARTAAVAG